MKNIYQNLKTYIKLRSDNEKFDRKESFVCTGGENEKKLKLE